MASHTYSPWWLHPVVPAFGMTGLTALGAWAIPPSSFEQEWRTWKHFGDTHLAVVAASLAAFGAGAVGVSRLAGGAEGDDESASLPWDALRILFNVSFALCLFGYVVWAGAAISRGLTFQLVLDVLRAEKSAASQMKEVYLVTVSGVSTFTQCGVAAMIVGALLGARRGWRGVWPQCSVIVLLAMVRAMLNSERLAVVELLLTGIVSWLSATAAFAAPSRRRLLAAAPVAGALFLYAGFTTTEYFRSWSNFYAAQGGSLFRFTAVRLSGYYVTALNNGALLFDRTPEPAGRPLYTAEYLARPIVADLLGQPAQPWSGSDLDPNEIFKNAANVEFNNPGGVFMPFLDFGVPMGLAYWALAGMAAGAMYALYLHRHPLGLFSYPVMFLGLVELPRIVYWAQGKFLPAALALAAAAAIAMMHRYRAAMPLQEVPCR